MSNLINDLYPNFVDPDTGRALAGGQVYIGNPDTDPTVEANRKALTLVQEDGTEVSIAVSAQPLTLSQGGVFEYNGSPVQVYVSGDYSLTAQTNTGAQKYYYPVNVELRTVSTYTEMRALSTTKASLVGSIYVLGRSSAGDGGEGHFRWVSGDQSAKVTSDPGEGVYVPPDSDTSGESGVWARQYSGALNPQWFGVVANDGTTDESTEVQNCFTFGKKIKFPDIQVRMNSSVSKTADDIEVDFGNAKFVNGGAQWLFNFGTTADTPSNKNLTLTGGYFTQANASTTSNLNYIKIAGTKAFSVSRFRMDNISNGGLYIEAGCEDGKVFDYTIIGESGYSTKRAIWLNGSTASDYAAQLIDISSFTRNATALPTFAAKDIKIYDGYIDVDAAYGVYLINTRDVKVVDNTIDIGSSGARCIAVNNYSPRAVISGNTLRASATATGILVTQYSLDVLIENNVFEGDFGGGRDIYVAYLAEALITGNRFKTDSTQQILQDNGGFAIVDGNWFIRTSGYSANVRCVRADTINTADAGTSTYGDTATVLAGLVFKNNIVKDRLSTVYVTAQQSASGNYPGMGPIVVSGNIFYGFDNASTANEYPLAINADGSTNKISYSFFDNTMYPAANADRNFPQIISGTGYIDIRSGAHFALFRVTVSSGSVSTAKRWGSYLSCSSTLSADDLVLSPRNIGGESGASVAYVVGVAPVTTNVYSYDQYITGSNVGLILRDSAGTQITLSSVDATVDVLVAHGTA